VQFLNDSWVVSPQDVIAQFECGHKVALSAARKNGALDDFHREENKELDLLKQHGLDHERRRLEQLDPKLRVKRLATDATHTAAAYEAAWEATKQAMDDEYDYQHHASHDVSFDKAVSRPD